MYWSTCSVLEGCSVLEYCSVLEHCSVLEYFDSCTYHTLHYVSSSIYSLKQRCSNTSYFIFIFNFLRALRLEFGTVFLKLLQTLPSASAWAVAACVRACGCMFLISNWESLSKTNCTHLHDVDHLVSMILAYWLAAIANEPTSTHDANDYWGKNARRSILEKNDLHFFLLNIFEYFAV